MGRSAGASTDEHQPALWDRGWKPLDRSAKGNDKRANVTQDGRLIAWLPTSCHLRAECEPAGAIGMLQMLLASHTSDLRRFRHAPPVNRRSGPACHIDLRAYFGAPWRGTWHALRLKAVSTRS